MQTKTLAEWEREEIERSARDAAKAIQRDLRMYDVARYMAPPNDTVYALEYCYALLGDVSGKCVLDLGCGDGLNAVALAMRDATVIGCDISPELIDVAHQRVSVNCTPEQAQRVDLRVGSAYTLPVEEKSIDIVLGIAILHHLDLAPAAREVQRVLRNGGRAIFLEPVRNSAVVRLVRRAIPYNTPDVSPGERPLTDAELERFVEIAGFATVRAQVFMLPTSNLLSVIPWLGEKTLHARHRWDARLLRRFPALRPFASLRVLECWL
jgi:SAM-dependent methyltransferase